MAPVIQVRMWRPPLHGYGAAFSALIRAIEEARIAGMRGVLEFRLTQDDVGRFEEDARKVATWCESGADAVRETDPDDMGVFMGIRVRRDCSRKLSVLAEYRE